LPLILGRPEQDRGLVDLSHANSMALALALTAEGSLDTPVRAGGTY
jgi:hypothetical protein